MSQLIAGLSSKIQIVFDRGKFDNWCVYIVEGGKKNAPKDLYYLTDLKELSKKYSSGKLYKDILSVYNNTYIHVDEKVIQLIDNIAETFFFKDQFIIRKSLIVVYAGMIAENNKEKTRLGKRIKLLAIHQLLNQNFTPEQAADFSRGKSWKELDEIMNCLGI